MRKMSLEVSQELGESTFCTTLDNGLKVYICQKKGFGKKGFASEAHMWHFVMMLARKGYAVG